MNAPNAPIPQAGLTPTPQLLDEDDNAGDFNLMDIWRMVRRHWLSVLVLALAGLALASWYARTLVPIYSSSVTVVIDPSRGSAPGITDYSYYYAQKLFYQTQETVLLSRVVAERAARRLSDEERALLLTPTSAPGVLDVVKKTLVALKDLVVTEETRPDTAPAKNSLPELKDTELTRWGGRIMAGRRIRPSQDSQIIRISFTSPVPHLAAVVANALADAYIEYTQETRETLSAQTGKWMAEQVQRLHGNLTQSEEALLEFQNQEGLVNLGDVESLASARLQQLNEDLSNAQRSFDELSKRYGPKHPRLIQAKSELESIRQELTQESQSILLDSEKRFRLAKLENDVDSNREIYEAFLARFRKMDFSANRDVSPIYMLDRAQVPGSPSSPDTQKIAMGGLFGGLFLGMLLALLREKLDNTIHNPGQLESELGLSALGVVPLLDRDDKRMDRKMNRKKKRRTQGQFERFYAHNPKSPFAESINHIRTGVLYSSAEHSPKTILITSAVQSEGKTTLATNLALAFSQMGNTLLIDADLRKPRVHQMMDGDDHKNGLVEYLVGRSDLDKSIIQDEQKKSLHVMKSGVIPPNPQELLSSDRFSKFLEEMEERFDYVVIDCAPVLPVSDALVLSTLVDAMILLVEANSTTKEMVKDAYKRLRSVKAHVVGCVLSQFDQRRSAYYGRYRYYSKYYTYAYGKRK